MEDKKFEVNDAKKAEQEDDKEKKDKTKSARENEAEQAELHDDEEDKDLGEEDKDAQIKALRDEIAKRDQHDEFRKAGFDEKYFEKLDALTVVYGLQKVIKDKDLDAFKSDFDTDDIEIINQGDKDNKNEEKEEDKPGVDLKDK